MATLILFSFFLSLIWSQLLTVDLVNNSLCRLILGNFHWNFQSFKDNLIITSVSQRHRQELHCKWTGKSWNRILHFWNMTGHRSFDYLSWTEYYPILSHGSSLLDFTGFFTTFTRSSYYCDYYGSLTYLEGMQKNSAFLIIIFCKGCGL